MISYTIPVFLNIFHLFEVYIMRVLVACECSQRVCCAFRALGYEAFSCDIQDCYGGHPEWHIKGDCLPLINMPNTWYLIIAHPPCTYLSRVQGSLIFRPGWRIKDYRRYCLGLQAAGFFRSCLNAKSPFVAVENPIPLSCWGFPKYTCLIQPYEFGHPYSKATCLWLKGLPPLLPTALILKANTRQWTQCVPGFSKSTKWRQSRIRSETFEGIAQAMASQWGPFVESKLSSH